MEWTLTTEIEERESPCINCLPSFSNLQAVPRFRTLSSLFGEGLEDGIILPLRVALLLAKLCSETEVVVFASNLFNTGSLW